jgi:aromatic ring-opening dioxygenase LigB subunit/AMMECR1 domain-containing protein
VSGQIVFAGVLPHGTELLPAEGPLDPAAATGLQAACRDLVERLVAAKPDLVVLIDPHGPTFKQAIGICCAPVIRGDLAAFGRPDVTLELQTDLQLSQLLLGLSKEAGIPLTVPDRYVRQPLSHGVIVPWQFLTAAGLGRLPVVLVHPSGQPLARHYEFGQVVGYAAQRTGRRVAVLASAELSHRHGDDAEAAAAYDRQVVEAFNGRHWVALVEQDPVALEAAGACGLGALAMLAGMFRPEAVESQPCHYEVDDGVGRMVGELSVIRHPEPEVETERPARDVPTLADLAREAIYCHVAKQETVRATGKLAETWGHRQAGVFVTLYRDGKIRNSLGSVFPLQTNVCDEVVRTAIAVAFQDPSHPAVDPQELPRITLSVQVVLPPEPIQRLDEVDPKQYGLIAYTGYRLGVLLPGVDGIEAAEDQVRQVMAKAGVGAGEPLWLLRFRVERSSSWDPQPLTMPVR